MATKIQYPEWVEKYRTKGCTIRKVRDGYGLYKCTSVSSPDLPYPKSKQEYLGMVTEKDGFIPKRSTAAHPIFIEYGLSRLIWINFKRTLLRSSYNGSENLIRLGIVYFIFGSVNENLLRYTFIADGHETEMANAINSTSPQRIKNISKKINELLDERIKDHDDRVLLESLMRCCVLDSKNKLSQTPQVPQAAMDIIERNGLKYGDG